MSEIFNLNKALLAASAAQEHIDNIHMADPKRVCVDMPLADYPGWGVHVESLPEGGGARYLVIHLHHTAHQHPTSKTKLSLVYDRQERMIGTDVPLNEERDRLADWHTNRAGVLAAVRKGTPRPGKQAMALLNKLLAHMP